VLRELQTRRALNALEGFYCSDLDEILARHKTSDPERHVVEFVRRVAREVPAYAQFLEWEGVDAAGLHDIDDFRRLKPTTKQNYHQAFSLPDLCRGGALESCDLLAVSSGSSGEPSVWPRFVSDEIGTTERFEQVLSDSFDVGNARTLGIVCFALGSWVGGMYTLSACRQIAAKGYPLTLATPGNNRAEILRVVTALGGLFEQVVLFGYPPFLKDVIDAGVAEGVDWSAYRVRLVTAGEVFSEAWRDLVCERLGAIDPVRHTASLYGTADGGVLANETPLSITIRRFLAQTPGAARELFGEARLPSLCQFDPLHRFFEGVDGELLFSGDGGVPLVRYRILDRGGVVPYQSMLSFLADHGRGAFEKELAPHERRDLPFVFVFGRSGFALSFYGANVYPENVAVGLEQALIAQHVTGKFVMQLRRTPDQDTLLEVIVELAPGHEAHSELANAVARSIQTQLERINSEFANYVPAERRRPEIRLLPAGDPEYFPVGVKHSYARHG
jgi:phenylacetate-CoA ligase